ncbi:uncharacterized protein EMH_0055110 [Eimeria mitis]|uniref:Uncharacterized protein n=1 Tax=Eimeria mitis TaxID=44415 RepID=U6KGV8_9EIME|nr:uncharacterized protein EMH_0055110 [Eimeria mitis]CDJ36011.1 hypothetical protein, conserved [Eimeria mitis]
MPDHVKLQYHQDMLRRQQERLASPSSLSALLHLGNSLVAANLKQALEREVELHWAAMTPTEVSATLNLLAKMKHRPTSALNKLGLAVQHSLHLYTPNLLSGCLLSFDILLYRHRSLLSSLSTFLLNKQIASPHHRQKRQERRQQYPRPSPRFVSQLSAVSATMPTAAAKTPALTATEAYIASRQHNLGQMQHQKEQEPSLGSEAEAQARRPFSLNELQPVERLPPDAHLPPPLAFDRHTRKDDIETTHLLEQVEMPKDALDRLVPSDGLSGNSRCFKSADSPGVSGLTAAPRRSTISLQSRAGAAAVALTVRGADIPCSVGVSIDPFLAAALLQHLSHIQHYKDPELLSRLLASVSAATANYGQQRMQHLLEPESDSRLRGSCPVPVTENSAGFPLVTCAESVHHVAEAANEVAATTVVASTSEVSFSTVASAGDPAALTANEATVRRRRGTPIGTHELHESWAEFASAAITAADALLPRWGKTRRASFSGPAPEASRRHGGEDNRTGGAELLNETVSSRGKSQPSGSHGVPSDQDTIRRLKEQGLHRALQFVTLPWSTFVSQFRKAIDLGTSRERPHTRNRLARKRRRTVNGFVPAGAEVARTVTKRECAADSMRRWACCRRAFLQPFQLVSLFSRQYPPSIGAEATASARTDSSGNAQLPPQPQLQLPSHQIFPFGISFADTAGTQALLMDTGPLLPPVLPKDAPSSLKKQVKQQHDKKMKCARQAQALLQRHQQRLHLPGGIDSPSVGASTATVTAGTANPPTVQAIGITSTSEQPPAFQSVPMICPGDSIQSAATPKPARARKDEQHRSRLLHAAAGALCAAANMKILTLRIARPFVLQLPFLCAESSCVATGTKAAAKDLSACCAAAAAALQTLGLRLDEPVNYAHSARRRNPRPPTPDLAVIRVELLISLEMAFRSPRFVALWRQAATDAASLDHILTQHRAEDNPQRRLAHLLPQAAYLYSVVFQALVNDVQRESTPSRSIYAWQQQQQQSALQFCNLLANSIATMMGCAAIANHLPSLTLMLNACRCLSAGVISARSVPKQQHSKQSSLTMPLQQTEKEIMRKLEQALTDTDANTEDLPSKYIRSSLVALVRSHQSTRRSAPPATVESAAEAEASFHPVVYALASKLHLTRNTIHRWVAEAAGAEELRLQRNQPS